MIACVLYAVVLAWSYSRVEGVVGYVGITVRDVPPVYPLFGFVVTGLMAAFVLPLRLTRPSQVAVWVLFLSWLIPALVLTYHVGTLSPEVIFRFVLALILSFVLLVVVARGRPLVTPRFSVTHTGFALVLGGATLVITLAVLSTARQTIVDPGVWLLDLTQVYSRRLAAREVMAENVLLGYAIATLSSALGPICLAYGFFTRRYVFAVLGAFGLVAIFAMDGTKSQLFVPVMMLGLVWLARQRGIPFGLPLTLGLAGLVAASMYLWLAQGQIWLSVFLVRRMLVGKATTLGAYFETFRTEQIYMRDTSLVRLFGFQPSLDKSNLVGEAFGSGIEENWNGSAWAEMYGDFGFPGLLITSVSIGLLLRVYDGTTGRAPFTLVAAMAGYAAYVWGEAALPTSLLTYGVFATLFLLAHYGSRAQTVPSRSESAPLPLSSEKVLDGRGTV